MAEIKFGTDGWRAVIAKDFTFDNVRLLSQSIALFLKTAPALRNKKLRVAIGYDTRFLSKNFAEAVAEVLCANGISVVLSSDFCPTPAVSLAIKQLNLAGGIMVTASHNPSIYNGIKYRNEHGSPAGKDILSVIEEGIGKEKVQITGLSEAEKNGLLEYRDLKQQQVLFCRKYLKIDLFKKTKINVLLDVMHGSGSGMAEKILQGTKVKLQSIRTDINPSFDGKNPEPIEKNLTTLSSLMKKNNFEIGLAVDGDADRIGAVAPGGAFISSHKIMSLLILHFAQDRKMKGAIVKTISSTFLIDKIAAKYGLKVYETPVGFKNISQKMIEEDVLVGGEESGGIGFKGYIPERDGILSGLLLLEMVLFRKKSIKNILKDMEKEYGKFFTTRIDIHYPDNLKQKLFSYLAGNPPKEILSSKIKETKTFDGIKFITEDGSWILFRLSGTEPILRIYAETNTSEKLKKLLKFGEKIAFSIKE